MYYVWGNPSTRMSMPRSSLGRSMIIRPEASSSSSPRERRNKERVIKPSKRIRQNLVYKPEEEILHEPYMLSLYREFSETPGYCDSAVEIPWNDIALPLAEIRLRQEEIERKKAAKVNNDDSNKDNTIKDETSEKRKSTGMMELPWNDLLVTELVGTKQEESSSLQREIEICDSTVEIPWEELGLDQPIEILPLPDIEACTNDDIEIPWDDIMLPKNIVIKSIRKKHPSASGKGRKRRVRPDQLDSNCQCIPGTGPKR